MKNLFLLAACLAPFMTLAQVSKGNFLLGGDVSASSTKAEYHMAYVDPFTGQTVQGTYSTRSRAASISPKAGYFVLTSFAVGMALPLTASSSSTPTPGWDTDAYSKSRSVGIGPFVRYYLPITESLFGIADAGYQVSFGYQEYNRFVVAGASEVIIIERDNTQSGILEGGVGLSWFLNQSVSVDARVTYRKLKSMLNDAPSADVNTIGLSGGFQVYLAR